jgi:hypothetical protein
MSGFAVSDETLGAYALIRAFMREDWDACKALIEGAGVSEAVIRVAVAMAETLAAQHHVTADEFLAGLQRRATGIKT